MRRHPLTDYGMTRHVNPTLSRHLQRLLEVAQAAYAREPELIASYLNDSNWRRVTRWGEGGWGGDFPNWFLVRKAHSSAAPGPYLLGEVRDGVAQVFGFQEDHTRNKAVDLIMFRMWKELGHEHVASVQGDFPTEDRLCGPYSTSRRMVLDRRPSPEDRRRIDEQLLSGMALVGCGDPECRLCLSRGSTYPSVAEVNSLSAETRWIMIPSSTSTGVGF